MPNGPWWIGDIETARKRQRLNLPVSYSILRNGNDEHFTFNGKELASTVAEVYGHEADAFLIAAAPELLQACQVIVHALKSYANGNELATEAVEFIEAVIAKAKGKGERT